MLDKVLVLIAMAGLAAFCGTVVYFVAVPDLTVTIVLILFVAFHDFWISVFRAQPAAGGPHLETDIEELPSAVSGHPLAGPKDDYTPHQ